MLREEPQVSENIYSYNSVTIYDEFESDRDNYFHYKNYLKICFINNVHNSIKP